MVFYVYFHFLFGAEDFDRRSDFKSCNLEKGVKKLIHDFLVGVVLKDGRDLANLVDLKGWKLNLILFNEQVRP